eukprot:1145926-Pelagomonas_calceolata.AAC.3
MYALVDMLHAQNLRMSVLILAQRHAEQQANLQPMMKQMPVAMRPSQQQCETPMRALMDMHLCAKNLFVITRARAGVLSSKQAHGR